ncbi:MAG: SdpA family antimicrobial peptide system protein [Microthrixaceae bacterium]
MVTWSVIGVVSIQAAMPKAVVDLPLEAHVRRYLPQGWAFFTRSPRAENIIALTRDANAAWEYGPRTQAGPGALGGWRRTQRVRSAEVQALASMVPAKDWVPCTQSVTTCGAGLRSRRVEYPLDIAVSDRKLCGKVLLAQTEIQPWVYWSRYGRAFDRSSAVTMVEVQC